MAEAFKKYQSFDFSKCNEWQTYYTNLFPIPPTNKVDRFKRKWYKNNIDQSFDIDYKEQETKQQQQYEEPPKPQPYKNNSLYTLENLLKIAVFPCSVLAEPYIVKICIVISSVLAVIRNKGMIKFSKEYLALVITSEFFHNIIFTISIPHGRNSFVFYLPIYIHFLSGLCGFIQAYPSFPIIQNQPQFKQFISYIIANRAHLILAKMKVEIFLFFYTIFGVFFGLSSFINVFLMFQFISMKSKISQQMQVAQYEFKNIIRSITPGPLKVVVEKLIMGYEKLLNLLTPSQ